MKKVIAMGFVALSLVSGSAFADAVERSETSPTILSNKMAAQIDLTQLAQDDARQHELEFSPSSINPGIRVINQSNRNVCIAITTVNPLKSIGWFALSNGEERVLYAQYIRAEECGNSDTFWSPGWDQNVFCKHPTSKFDYFTPDNFGMCSQLGGTMATYYRVPQIDGIYNWTLNF